MCSLGKLLIGLALTLKRYLLEALRDVGVAWLKALRIFEGGVGIIVLFQRKERSTTTVVALHPLGINLDGLVGISESLLMLIQTRIACAAIREESLT